MTATSGLRDREELERPESSTLPARRRWPSGCVKADEIERRLHATDVGDPNAAVDELLMMLVQRRVMSRSQSSPAIPPPRGEVWLRAYVAAAAASESGVEAAMDAVETASLEWQKLIQYAGPEQMSRAVVDEFRFWILDRDRCRAHECHELWAELWTRRMEWTRRLEAAASDPDPDRSSLDDTNGGREVWTSFETTARGDVEAFERYRAAERAWESAWDSALRTLRPEPAGRDRAQYVAARHVHGQEARTPSAAGR